jgi:hypothetical protein
MTLRETVERLRGGQRSPFSGSAETVADEIERWFEGRALDGINVHVGHPGQFTRFLQEVVPILQDRGLFRRDYEANTLRGNLGLTLPANPSPTADAAPARARCSV